MSLHRMRFYRYEVGCPKAFRVVLNRYSWRVIGLAFVVGRYAYCVKWANA